MILPGRFQRSDFFFVGIFLQGDNPTALLHVDYFSEVLGLCCQADVILPQKLQGIGQDAQVHEGDLPVLWPVFQARWIWPR
jgi:hypothetical protein